MLVRDLGTLLVDVDGTPCPTGGRKPAAILAVLVVHLNRRVPVDELVEIVWGGRPASISTLESHVWRLRRLLEPGRRAGERPTVLVNDSGGYRLLLGTDAVDSSRFVRHADDAGDLLAQGRAGRALDRIDTALALWRGRPFSPFSEEDWAGPAVARLDEVRSQLVEHRVDALLALGEPARALTDLEVVLRETPYRERGWAQRMLALHRCGRGEEALQSFRQVRTLLREELGTEPGAELHELHQRILAQDPVLAVPRPVRSGRPVEVHLPARTPPLIGRAAELAALARLLVPGRMVSVVGPAGCGKTRLAVEVAHAATASFPDGVHFVDLATVTDPGIALDVTVAALGVGAPPVGTALDVLRDAVRDRRVLLVLDNCEHLLAEAALVGRTVLADGDGAVLATSREPVGTVGETVWTLRPLDVAAEGPDPGAAVALFLARAQEAEPTLETDAAGLAAVRRICTGLDGLPLALELAAARTRTYSLDEIADQVARDPLGLAPTGVHGVRRSLSAAIQASYTQLPEGAAHLHRCLAVLPGSFTAALAGAVADGPVDGMLPLLVDRSLLTSARSARPGGPSLFRQLETVRHQAARMLDASGDPRGPAERRDAWVRARSAAAPRLGRVEAADWYRTVDDDYPAFRAMLQRGLGEGGDRGVAAVAAGLVEYWFCREQLAEGTRILRAVAPTAAETAAEPPAGAAVLALLGLADVELLAGRADRARPHLDRAVGALPALAGGELLAAGTSLATVAFSAHADQELAVGAVAAGQLADLADRTGDADLDVARDVVACIYGMAATDPAHAAALAQAAHDKAAAHGNLLASFMACVARCLAAIRAGDPLTGIAWSGRMLDAVIRLGAGRGTSSVEIVGILHGMAGRHATAVPAFAAARAHARRAATPWPRRPVTLELLAAARHDLTRAEFEQAWRSGDAMRATDVRALLREAGTA